MELPLLANTISISFLSAVTIPTYLYVRTGDTWFLWFMAAIFGVNIGTAGIKELTGSLGGVFARPAGAAGCDAFCMMGPVGGRPGFPSGHMTTASMLVAGLWFRLHAPIVLWIGVPWLFAMAWARWFKRCHNLVQIAAGTLVGFAAAAIIAV